MRRGAGSSGEDTGMSASVEQFRHGEFKNNITFYPMRQVRRKLIRDGTSRHDVVLIDLALRRKFGYERLVETWSSYVALERMRA